MSLPYKMMLDSLPVEVIEKILEYVKLEGLIQLIEHNQFLSQNLNIKAAMNQLICNTNISYNNRITQPSFLHMYCRTPTYIDKNSLQFLPRISSLFNIIDYCIEEHLQSSITISFYIWLLKDIDEFLSTITSINNSVDSKMRFNIEIEFNRGLLYNLSLNYIFDVLADHLGQGIESITVYNYSGSFTFHIARFPKLRNIWFEDSNVKFGQSFQFATDMKTLTIHPNSFGWNNNHPVYLHKSVPHSLQRLKLGSCVIKEKSINYGIPQDLESLDLTRVGDRTDFQYIRPLIEQNLSNNLKELSVDYLWGAESRVMDLDIILFDIPENFQKMQQLNRFAIIGLNRSIDFSSFKLTDLTIKGTQHSRIINECHFPITLKKLDISNNHLADLSNIDKNLPELLEHLNIADNPIDWDLYIPKFEKFNKLKNLKLSNTHVRSHLTKIIFPDSIVELSLEVNQISSIENVRFPENLSNLGIGSNLIKHVHRPSFPPGLKTVHLTENKLSGPLDLSKNSSGKELNIEILYLNYTLLSNIQEINLPNNLRILNFDYCIMKNISNIEFPASILELSLSACEISTMKNISWESGSRLRYICLSHNELSKFDIKFPPSVETINLAGNKISTVNPNVFNNLENLQTLILSSNKFERFVYQFNSISLRSLDLSFNNIRILNVAFPKNSITELRSINLCSNKLTNLTPVMIGHDRDLTFHNKLIEIDITDNRIKADDIEKTVGEFPSSLKCLFVGYTGERDRFGYDIASNIIEGRYCPTKRVDVPIHE
ncbi:uncharacterized protein J8A68_002276 [[Candida] subhashii]|uniref:F-box domain-containing protein n=1 Tax=[Candida] subhashii TaxID=561895 RepID=A0A8J5QL95_9ASCO|nr:uncharacterized protein J8A68_002276 [[Candida] subhashii]KAG7664213.1 hypothetical protein J8A68_002276 [[Candida] subhashii]